jgi:hypothetical protein
MKETVRNEVELPHSSPSGEGAAGQKTVDILKKNFA